LPTAPVAKLKKIKSYDLIDKATLKSACERFCKPGAVHSQTHTKQNNMMMSICLAKSLTADVQARLLTYRNKYTFDGVEYAPLIHKIIMRLATIDSVATTQMLRNNLQSLGTYAIMASGNIDRVHSKFDKNYSQLIARGATVNNPIAFCLKLTLWLHATTSSRTFTNSMRITSMVNSPPLLTRPS
jgi:hypothetical protein